MKNLFDHATAILSDCGLYRYCLTRQWDVGPTVCWIMLNPSKADAEQDDPTINRVVGFSQAWGYGRAVVVNLFAFRATDPKVMLAAPDPVGPGNDNHLVCIAHSAETVVCAWGNDGRHLGRAARVVKMLRGSHLTLHCLKLTQAGQPWHPLYLPATLKPVEFAGDAST